MSSQAPEAQKHLGHFAQADLKQDAILDVFVSWAVDQGWELYPAQEEAILAVLEGSHVLLSTPTGSGKSLVALAMHFKALCENKRSFYTAPVKALVSEKFFNLCEYLGAENVGMLTSDASINRDAPIMCCTAEILSNMALNHGEHAPFDYAVLDEFHYYGDRDRGMAWQVPLLECPQATFLLMSATLGNMRFIAQDLAARSGKKVEQVTSTERPVPLDYDYRSTPLHETIEDLAKENRLPVYLVNFTQRDAAEQAQNLTSLKLADKKTRREIASIMGSVSFDTPYGKQMKRFLQNGVGLHHAGLLPKYRLLVENLAQKSLLKVISGTDTLGVGVNIPIRTVLFTKLYKFDGQQLRILRARNFHQIAGRAGRKGFDEAGSVVCQAPVHVIANKKLLAKASSNAKGGRRKKVALQKPPKGYVGYNEDTFDALIVAEPEALESSFRVDPGIVTQTLQQGVTWQRYDGGYARLVKLIARCHDSPKRKSQHRQRAAQVLRALLDAGIAEHSYYEGSSRKYLRLKEGLQRNFSLHQSLAIFLLEAIFRLDQGLDTYPFDVLSVVEAVTENPRALIFRIEDKLKRQRLAELKAEGVPYEERIEKLDEVTYPKPNANFIYATFDDFRQKHPWLREFNVAPKGLALEMYDRYCTFNDYVLEYGLERSEGLLLRYLNQVYKSLAQSVPEEDKSEELYSLEAYLRSILQHVDDSLLREWESRIDDSKKSIIQSKDFTLESADKASWNDKAILARIRSDLNLLVKALATQDYPQALSYLYFPPDSPAWDVSTLRQSFREFWESYDAMFHDHRARLSQWTNVTHKDANTWDLQQVLLDSEDEQDWALLLQVELARVRTNETQILILERIVS
jgi:superfamily II RNA helicase